MSFRKILSETFPKSDKNAWLKVASSEINGNNPFESLRWATRDNLTFKPYYDRSDVDPLRKLQSFRVPPTSNIYGSVRHWAAIAHVSVSHEKPANILALQHLKNESDGIIFLLKKDTVDFDILLKEIEWPYCSISFVITNHLQAEQLQEYIRKKYSERELSGTLFWTDTSNTGPFPTIKGFRSAGVYIESSSPTTEIADALFKAVRLIYQIQSTGLETKIVIDNIAFYVPVGNNFLTEISKLKALRMLWYQVSQAFDIKTYRPEDLYIHTRSEVYNNEAYEPHGNMLSNTVSAMAAIAGGCLAHSLHPADESDNLLSRIALNNHYILRDEAHFNKVADPFAGSYVIENMTKEIAEVAWKKFQESIDQ
jgi:methylmalonyl-CoA mutase